MANADANGGNGGASAKKLLGGNALWGGGLAAVHCGLIMVQLGQGGANVLNKVAMTTGVNTFVFAVYRDLVALAILIPTAYFAERKQIRPLTFPILGLMLGSGMTGGGCCEGIRLDYFKGWRCSSVEDGGLVAYPKGN
ncbi:unnamed protein product [Calypogeia fissa]